MSDPVMSPDGKWMWTGTEWIPAPPSHNSLQDTDIRPDLISFANEMKENSHSDDPLLGLAKTLPKPVFEHDRKDLFLPKQNPNSTNFGLPPPPTPSEMLGWNYNPPVIGHPTIGQNRQHFSSKNKIPLSLRITLAGLLIGLIFVISLIMIGGDVSFDGIVDSDDDGYVDSDDDFPNEKTQWLDSDGDGRGDNPLGFNADLFPEDPFQWSDSDNDKLSDQFELAIYFTSPYDNDTDNDGLWDGIEIERGSSPLLSDTDGDGFADNEDLWPLENWVLEINYGGTEVERNDLCDSRRMGWQLSTSSTGEYSSATTYGTGGASDIVYLDLPDNQNQYQISLNIVGWYSNCPLTNEEQLFWGFDSPRDDSDCGIGDSTSANFEFTASPSMSSFQSSETGTRTSGDWTTSGWLSKASVTVESQMVTFELAN
jgi:hypothetical protein